jgi:hydrogenase maturation protease
MILLLAVGNSLRSDDGAGHLLAAALAPALEALLRRPTRILSVHQLAPEHALALIEADVEAVVFCDAMPAHLGRPPLDAVPVAPGVEGGTGFTHDLSPALLLAYATACAPTAGWQPPPSWVATVAAEYLDHGEQLSARTTTALADAPALAERLASAIHIALRPPT